MKKRATWSVRRLLYVLTAAAVIPPAGLLGFSVYEQYQVDSRNASVSAFNLAQVASDNVQTFLSDAEQVLAKISARPLIRNRSSQDCDPIFGEFKDLYPQFSNLSQSSPDGYIVCSSTAQRGGIPTFVGDTAWFKQAFNTQKFTVAQPYLGPVTKRVVAVLAHPVFSTEDTMVGSVQMPIDLAKFRVIPGADKLPESTIISIFNSAGILVARSRDADQFVGKNLSDAPAIKMFLSQRRGTGRSTSSQGVDRIFGFVPIPGTDWIAVAGIATDVVLQDAREAALRNLVLGGLTLLLVLALAVYLANRISRPIAAVQAAARKVAAGDGDARAPQLGPLEIVEVATEFNLMLDAIRSSQTQLADAQSELILLGTCVAHLTDMVIILDNRTRADGWPVISFVNAAFEHISGYARNEVVGRPTTFLHGPQTDLNAIATISAGLDSSEPFRTELLNYTRNGTELWIELDMVPIHAIDKTLTHWVSIERDVTSRRLAEQHIHQLAYFDLLTHLPNRPLLMDRMETALAKAQRDKLFGVVLFIDLDNFKNINDARGHAVGDALLQEVALRLVPLVRQEDTVARLGGDEFVVLMTGMAPDANLAALMGMSVGEKLREALSHSFDVYNQPYTTSASIGVALLRCGDQTPHDLLREADTAMYRAKNSGRNRVAFFEPLMQTEIEIRLALEHDLARALAQRQIAVYVQTQVDRFGEPAGAELLLRWLHPARGFVSPMQFVPIAEDTGLILDLGAWVMEQACLVLVQLHHAGNPLPISINVSPKQFRQSDFVQQVQSVLAQTGAQASKLIFEITEGLLIADLEATILRMSELVAIGIRFSIDDFGTGYSSLAYLKRLPLHELKIDKSFVQDTPRDTNDTAIVRLILSMAKHIGLQVVAEGVETEEQAEFLISNGCGLLQGYLYARPIPIQDWIRNMLMPID